MPSASVEPAKWIAKLRDTAKGGQFLLKTEMVAGHGGVQGVMTSGARMPSSTRGPLTRPRG